MKISTYEICKTNTPEHLNGTIVIIDEDGKDGHAVLIVKDGSEDLQSSYEKIIKTSDGWKTKTPHNHNGTPQDWIFTLNYKPKNNYNEEINERYKGTGYSDYIKYDLKKSENGKENVEAKSIMQNNGSGTAGNTSGG